MFEDAAPLDTSNVIALLCIGDVLAADGEAALPLTPMFGQPIIHHTVKALQSIGITKFVIGVDTVPGALLTYRDTVSNQGLDLRFVREPSAMAPLLEIGSRVVLLRADTLLHVDLIKDALRDGGVLVATVEERAENQIFERIDLNSRWAGMAVLDRTSIDAITQLPDGWDMASALLRQALQDGVKSWPIKQSEIQAGTIRRVANAADLSAAQSEMLAQSNTVAATLEDRLFSNVLARFAPKIWSVDWGPRCAAYGFPILATVAASLAVAGVGIGAAITALAAVIASLPRKMVRSAEYRAENSDWLGWASWAVLTIAVIAVLKIDQPSLLEAGFLGFALSGLALIPAIKPRKRLFRLLSPLVISLALLLGVVAGETIISAKLMIIAEIMAQLYRAIRKADDPKSQD
jgi:hypothetical protein